MKFQNRKKEKADKLHNELVEKAAENDDEVMELYFDKVNWMKMKCEKDLELA